jgi:hypothetical protein
MILEAAVYSFGHAAPFKLASQPSDASIMELLAVSYRSVVARRDRFLDSIPRNHPRPVCRYRIWR